MLKTSTPYDHHQTLAEIMEWERQRDQKKDDFPVIRLDAATYNLLFDISEKKSDYVCITGKNEQYALRLRDLDFIRISVFDCPEKQDKKFCEIRPRGENYLNYVESEKARIKQEHAHNWKIAVFSALAGALLSEPLWIIIRFVLDSLRA